MPKPASPPPIPASEPIHFWSAQCVRCHTVGNMSAKILEEGIVCMACLKGTEPSVDVPTPVTVTE